jgi:hypothetical protein
LSGLAVDAAGTVGGEPEGVGVGGAFADKVDADIGSGLERELAGIEEVGAVVDLDLLAEVAIDQLGDTWGGH